MNESVSTICSNKQGFTLICVHDPTEGTDDKSKDALYAKPDNTYNRCLAHNVKIVQGNFNEKVGPYGREIQLLQGYLKQWPKICRLPYGAIHWCL